ncbi:reverse transcriptase domain-containing protein [Tanacetum coccineum]
MNKFMEIFPTLTAPIKGEALTMYLTTSTESISATLFTEREEGQVPIYFRSNIEKKLPKDFLVKIPSEENKKEAAGKMDTKLESTKLNNAWKLYTDGASSSDGSGAGLMLINPRAKDHTFALRFKFITTNNEVEYEALLVGLQIAHEMEIKSLAILADSQLMNQNKKADVLRKLASMTFEHLTKKVLVKVLVKRSIDDREVLQVEVKKGENWMTPIHEYLLSGDPRKFRKIRIKAPEYKLIKGSLYKKILLYTMASLDATKVIRNYSKCKEQSTAKKAAGKEAIATGSVWPFSHCGVSILGPLPMAPGGESFVTKDDRNAAKENAKRKERKEVASIEEAYYQNKLRMYHDVKSNRST